MKSQPIRAISLFLLILSVLFILTPAAKAATTITVNTIADNNTGGDGSCTLREAILAANGSPANNDCGPDSGTPYTVNFSISGTITLNSALPNIASNMTIDGSGHLVTVSGNGTVRVFYVNIGYSVNLNGLTVANGLGDYGGGIKNEGALTVTNSTIFNNRATYGGGIETEGALTIANSTFSDNSATYGGGGIYNYSGPLTVTNSTISSNSASSWGGGILNDNGTLTVTNSTISVNSSVYGGGIGNSSQGTCFVTNITISGNSAASNGGGGISNEGTFNVTNSTVSSNTATYHGGGIANFGTLTVTNSTITGNSATYGGGIYNYYGSITLTNSTLADNSTIGIYNNNSTLNVMNSIIAKGSASGYCCYGGHTDAYSNLADDNTCGSGFTESASILLGTLGDYGGSTQTIPLLLGSAALDAGDDAICAASPVNSLDQRGVSRPMGMHCDIGAFECRGQVKRLSDGTIFDSIQDAYDSVSSGTITILAQAYVIPEELLLNNDSNVTLKGGMDSNYNPTVGYSPVNKLTVERGQAVISNMIIK